MTANFPIDLAVASGKVMPTLIDKIPSYSAALAQERQMTTRLGRRLKVQLGGNCNVEFLRPGLSVALNFLGFDADVGIAHYDDWLRSALAEGKQGADVWIIWLSAIGASRGGIDRRRFDTSALRKALDRLISEGALVIVIPPEVVEPEIEQTLSDAGWRRDLRIAIEQCLPDRTILLDPIPSQITLGWDAWRPGRYWTLAKAPCHPNAATRVGLNAALIIATSLKPLVKAVVVDLDNTLWGGTIGDDGIDGLVLDPDGEGRPYAALQSFLKGLSDRGIPLTVVSKNDPENAKEPFLRSEDLILKMEDFVYFKASWSPKHIGIRKIAECLNIGIDSICFLDDSVHERAEARMALPGLIVPELPADPEEVVAYLAATGLFSLPVLRREDMERVAHYRADVKREDIRLRTRDPGEFLASLGMEMRADVIVRDSLDRAVNLFQKTNQFELTGWRPSPVELTDFISDESSCARVYRLKDRFGDSGIISAVAGRFVESRFEISNWVISCRVFNRTLEEAILGDILSVDAARQELRITIDFRRTKKNQYALARLEQLGFRSDEAGSLSLQLFKKNLPKTFIAVSDE
jgi:FkbH-like protein